MKIKVRARRAAVALIMGCLLLPQLLWAEEAIDSISSSDILSSFRIKYSVEK